MKERGEGKDALQLRFSLEETIKSGLNALVKSDKPTSTLRRYMTDVCNAEAIC